jgi:hypothetical protein
MPVWSDGHVFGVRGCCAAFPSLPVTFWADKLVRSGVYKRRSLIAEQDVRNGFGARFSVEIAFALDAIRRHSCYRRIRSWSSRGRILMFSDVWLAKQTRNAEEISFR